MPKQVASDVALSIRQRIKSGEWDKTRILPNERDLAVEYGVARNTLRRAIMNRISGTSPLDIMNVRMILEPQAAAAAAANASEADLGAIREAHETAIASLQSEVFEGWDEEFDKRIFASTRNEFLTNLHDILRVIRNRAPWLEIKRRTFSEERRLGYCAEHTAIIEA